MSLALLDDDPQHAQMAAGAVQDLDALDALVAELLLVGRVGGGGLQRVPVDLGALARSVAGSDVAVQGEGTVAGDAVALRRVLVNLVDNARRYGAPPIRVEVADGQITVTDAGEGVPASERERIFEAFYRPSGHHEGRDGGVGLGLALVREIARAHGGDVWCEGGPAGTGARFCVRLAPGVGPREGVSGLHPPE
jgi:signal transduction histidine kinase